MVLRGYFDEYKALAPHNNIDKEYNISDYQEIHQHAYAPTCFLMISRRLWEASR